MLLSDYPCLSLAIDRLSAADVEHYAIWVVQAPYPGGYVHHDRIWCETQNQAWTAWQDLFSLRHLPLVPHVAMVETPETQAEALAAPESAQPSSYTSRAMQQLGVTLWQWLFDGPIQSSLDQSQGIAIGQVKPLQVRLEIRDPNLTALPWEIMQAQAGKQAIALSQQLLFSRTTSDVDPLSFAGPDHALKILLVLGQEQDEKNRSTTTFDASLQLQQEAHALTSLLQTPHGGNGVPVTVTALLQPTPAELIEQLETGGYNVFFYAGHGVPAPDGGSLFLQSEATMNGTELAQVLTRCQVKLAVFNACWGARPDQDEHRAIPRSSLAEVLIHHGVPAVLGMRDSIADDEARSFIQVFSQSLAERLPIAQAVAIARQHLLTLYKFNQPAWTLPVLYMHPEFDGVLVSPVLADRTELPTNSTGWPSNPNRTLVIIRSVNNPKELWPVRGGLMRVGRRPDNDLVISEQWVSQQHAVIFYRPPRPGTERLPDNQSIYFLQDFSRFGTLIRGPQGWQTIHHQEVPIQPGTQLKFGSSRGKLLEFVLDE